MIKAANLGFPHIGARRELKKALESFWAGQINETELKEKGWQLKARNLFLQRDAGVEIIPSNDFTFYDQMLDTTAMLGAVPKRFGHEGGEVSLKTYFAMARGSDDAFAMEMTKWFDTNYHYLVPEFYEGMSFSLSSNKAVEAYVEAKALGVETRPVLIGPLTWLCLGKSKSEGLDPLSLLGGILPVYEMVLAKLQAEGAREVQIDEPVLSLDLKDAEKAALSTIYHRLAKAGPDIMLASYFGAYGDNLDLVLKLPVKKHHLDVTRGGSDLERMVEGLPAGKALSLGLVDGRNIWASDLQKAGDILAKVKKALGAERVEVAPSCSLRHVPVDLDLETKLDREFVSWLAFAKQKLVEISALSRASNAGEAVVAEIFEANRKALNSRRHSSRIHNKAVKDRLAGLNGSEANRASPYIKRVEKQRDLLGLPLFPTTTIGSFPQTKEVRQARADFKAGRISEREYDGFLKKETENCIRKQEELGLDMLVHGEFERNDMVEYFGEQLAGFAFTQNGWVQSYGSRYVKPPVIFGDVSRPKPMTVEWSRFAQSLTERPMKGMLTGPVTILQWSFVRDDQPRSETCRQIALAIRDEVVDLEAAGIKAIQIDEPAVREGLPLRQKDWQHYLDWAVECFRLSAAGVRDETQIHTHMCYSEFNDIMASIAALDADVISIETSRSDMELLKVFSNFNYPNEIGPGVWDIHSPRVPKKEEMLNLMQKAARTLPSERLWVNPDCGLKTRNWLEVTASLERMVQVAEHLRTEAQGIKAAS